MHSHTYTYTYTYTYAYIRQNPMDNTETQKRCQAQKGEIKQQKSSLFHYQEKISKHLLSTFNHQQKSFMSESWNTKLRSV